MHKKMQAWGEDGGTRSRKRKGGVIKLGVKTRLGNLKKTKTVCTRLDRSPSTYLSTSSQIRFKQYEERSSELGRA